MRSCENFRKLLETDCVPIIGAFNGLVARNVADKGLKIKKNLLLKKII